MVQGRWQCSSDCNAGRGTPFAPQVFSEQSDVVLERWPSDGLPARVDFGMIVQRDDDHIAFGVVLDLRSILLWFSFIQCDAVNKKCIGVGRRIAVIDGLFQMLEERTLCGLIHVSMLRNQPSVIHGLRAVNLGPRPATFLDQRNELRSIDAINQNDVPGNFLDLLLVLLGSVREHADTLAQRLVRRPHGFQGSLVVIARRRKMLGMSLPEAETSKKCESKRYFFH